jgi:hypothetical protein
MDALLKKLQNLNDLSTAVVDLCKEVLKGLKTKKEKGMSGQIILTALTNLLANQKLCGVQLQGAELKGMSGGRKLDYCLSIAFLSLQSLQAEKPGWDNSTTFLAERLTCNLLSRFIDLEAVLILLSSTFMHTPCCCFYIRPYLQKRQGSTSNGRMLLPMTVILRNCS